MWTDGKVLAKPTVFGQYSLSNWAVLDVARRPVDGVAVASWYQYSAVGPVVMAQVAQSSPFL